MNAVHELSRACKYQLDALTGVFALGQLAEVPDWSMIVLRRFGDAGAKRAPKPAPKAEGGPLEPEEGVIREFLTAIRDQVKACALFAPVGVLQLVTNVPDNKNWVPNPFGLGQIDEMVKVAAEASRGGSNVYIEPRTVNREGVGAGKRGDKDATAFVFAFVIDSDDDKGKASAFQPEASIIVASGGPGNEHRWLFLDQPIERKHVDKAIELGSQLRAACGNGEVGSGTITTPFRIPGTINYPTKIKREERGRVPAMTSILKNNGKVWSAEELRAVMPKILPSAPKAREQIGNGGAAGDGAVYATYEEALADLKCLACLAPLRPEDDNYEGLRRRGMSFADATKHDPRAFDDFCACAGPYFTDRGADECQRLWGTFCKKGKMTAATLKADARDARIIAEFEEERAKVDKPGIDPNDALFEDAGTPAPGSREALDAAFAEARALLDAKLEQEPDEIDDDPDPEAVFKAYRKAKEGNKNRPEPPADGLPAEEAPDIAGEGEEGTSEDGGKAAGAPSGNRMPDGRIIAKAPLKDEVKTPVLRLLDRCFAASSDLEPPMRALDRWPVEILVRKPRGNLHELGPESDEGSRLPPPELPLLTRHDVTSMALMIERYIFFWMKPKKTKENPNPKAREVALDESFVRHYLKFRDSSLPTVRDVLTMPLVLESGKLLAKNGLNRKYGAVLRIDPAMLPFVPERKDATPEAVKAAMTFLCEVWLTDVTTDIEGKCVLLAMALTIIERSLFAERPIFFATAGKRGGGKTTAFNMISLAVTGKHAPVAAWAKDEDEIRKAILSYLLEGMPFLAFDNILAGATIKSPTLDKLATALEYTDRRLGVTGIEATEVSTIIGFTGNNIAPGGELASRSLIVRINVERPDPENRDFKHPDPIGWTLDHRGKTLRALYTIMLGNPQLKRRGQQQETRFKTWWLLIGSALEHAAKQIGQDVSFAKLFKKSEEEDESEAINVDVLLAIRRRLGDAFVGTRGIFDWITEKETEHNPKNDDDKLVEYFFRHDALGREIQQISPQSIGNRLKPIIGAPYFTESKKWLTLTRKMDRKAKTNVYKINEVTAE